MAGRYTSARALTEASMAVGITVILSLMGIYIPMFSLLAFLIWPVPPALLGVRHGMRWSIMATSATILLLTALTGPMMALGMGLSLGPMGIFLGEAFRERWSGMKTLFGAAVVFLVGFVLQFAILLWVMDIHILDMYYRMMDESMTNSFAILEKMNTNPIALDQARQQLQEQRRMMHQLEPFILLSVALLTSFLNIQMARLIFRRLGIEIPPFPAVAEWEMPRATLYAYVAVVMVEYFMPHLNGWMLATVLNIKVACMYLVWIQGIAVLFWLGRRFPLLGRIKWVLLVFGMLVPVFMAMLFMGGLFDLATSYRKNQSYR